MQSGSKNDGSKASHTSGWGASLLNKLPSITRERRKRAAIKRVRARAKIDLRDLD